MNCKFCEGICDWVIQGHDWYGTIRELRCQQCGRWQDEDDEEDHNGSSDPEEIARANSHIVGARRARLSPETYERLVKIQEGAKKRREELKLEKQRDDEYIEFVKKAVEDRKYWGDSPSHPGAHDPCYEMVERLLKIVERLRGE